MGIRKRTRAMRPRLIACLFLLCAAVATPCSFDTAPTYAFEVRPDAPIDLYVNGRLGVLQPTYARSHLVVAWRYLSGNPPTGAEREGFGKLLRHRLGEDADERDPGARQWERTRALVRGTSAQVGGVSRYYGNHGWFVNCTDDAFRTAAATLADRAKTFGVSDRGVQSWLAAQDLVFLNCEKDTAMPPPAEPFLPTVLRADREYQMAAADFYAMRYDEARARLASIARDPDSPWRAMARLVAVRALLRRGTLNFGSSGSYPYRPDALAEAERELRDILADGSLTGIHDAARDLLSFVIFRTDPQRRFDETVRGLTSGNASARRARVDLADYTYLLDRDLDLKVSDDLTEWIRAFQGGAFDEVRDRWRETKKTHWLVAALTHASSKDAQELVEASAEITTDSPAYPHVAYHRARLLSAAGMLEDARSSLDRALALDEKSLPPSARNQLLALRRPLAHSLEEYLRDIQPVAVGYATEQLPESFDGPMLPTDASVVINAAMPLHLLAKAARAADVHPGVRDQLLIAAFAKALLLERSEVAEELAPLVGKLYPTLGQRIAKWQAASGDRRRFAAVDLLVHAPGLRPYVIPLVHARTDPMDVWHARGGDTNWWCRGGLPYYEAIYPDAFEKAGATTPLFLRDATDAMQEQSALMASGSGPTWLLRNAIAWAKSRPNDAKVPEALSLAIHGTRWSCPDAETEDLARAAHRLLHARYGQTQWARETKYWYTGRD